MTFFTTFLLIYIFTVFQLQTWFYSFDSSTTYLLISVLICLAVLYYAIKVSFDSHTDTIIIDSTITFFFSLATLYAYITTLTIRLYTLNIFEIIQLIYMDLRTSLKSIFSLSAFSKVNHLETVSFLTVQSSLFFTKYRNSPLGVFETTFRVEKIPTFLDFIKGLFFLHYVKPIYYRPLNYSFCKPQKLFYISNLYNNFQPVLISPLIIEAAYLKYVSKVSKQESTTFCISQKSCLKKTK